MRSVFKDYAALGGAIRGAWCTRLLTLALLWACAPSLATVDHESTPGTPHETYADPQLYSSVPRGFDTFLNFRNRTAATCVSTMIARLPLENGMCRTAFFLAGHCVSSRVGLDSMTVMIPGVIPLAIGNRPGRLHGYFDDLNSNGEVVNEIREDRYRRKMHYRTYIPGGRDYAVMHLDVDCKRLGNEKPARLAACGSDGKVLMTEGEAITFQKRNRPAGNNPGGGARVRWRLVRKPFGRALAQLSPIRWDGNRVIGGDSGSPVANDRGELVGATSATDNQGVGDVHYFDSHAVCRAREQLQAWNMWPPVPEPLRQEIAQDTPPRTGQPSYIPIFRRPDASSQPIAVNIEKDSRGQQALTWRRGSESHAVFLVPEGNLVLTTQLSPDGTRLIPIPAEARQKVIDFYRPFTETPQALHAAFADDSHRQMISNLVNSGASKPPEVRLISSTPNPISFGARFNQSNPPQRQPSNHSEPIVKPPPTGSSQFECVAIKDGGFRPRRIADGSRIYPPLGSSSASKADCEKAVENSANGLVCSSTSEGNWKPTHFSGHTRNRRDYGFWGSSIDLNSCLKATRLSTSEYLCAWFGQSGGWAIKDTGGNDTVHRGPFRSLDACIAAYTPAKPRETVQTPPPTRSTEATGHYGTYCASCHATGKATPFQAWVLDPGSLDLGLKSSDSKTREYSNYWANQLYSALVDKKNMPPSRDARASLHQEPEIRKLVEYLENRHLGTSTSRTPTSVPPAARNAVQVAPQKTVETYRALTPQIASPELQAILHDPNTLFFDETSMPSAYQDSSRPVVGVRNTNNPTLVPGAPFRDPKTGKLKVFSHGAGKSEGSSARTYSFLSLPKDANGDLQKIKVWVHQGNSSLSNGGDWKWTFPIGTVSGEIDYNVDSQGFAHVLEIRTHKKESASGEAPDVFVPFPTKADLVARLTEIRDTRPELQAESARVLAEVQNAPLFPLQLTSEGYADKSLQFTGGSMRIPHTSEALTKELLNVPFRSALGAVWDSNGSVTAFAPTTTQAFGIVPQHSRRGAIPTDRDSCMRCHQKTDIPIVQLFDYDRLPWGSAWKNHLDQNTYLYGQTPGNDKNFKFHMFDPRYFQAFSQMADNRRLRAALLPILDIQK